MTTKDQAIALVIAGNDQARSCGFVTGTTNWAGVIVNVLNAQPPAPDCRTCGNYAHDDDNPQCKLWNGCTNGDQYKAAPSVVLWRTES